MASAKKTTKKKTGRKPALKKTSNTTRKNKKTSNMGFTLRKEIKGLILIVIGIVLTMGLFGVDLGVSNFFNTLLAYTFGVGAFIPVLGIFYWGWNLLYYGQGIKITMRGFLYLIFITFGLAILPLWNIDAGQELNYVNLAANGGFIGNGLAHILRYLFATAAILVDAVIIIVAVIIITGISISKGVRRAGQTATKASNKVKEKATEQIVDVKEQITDWHQEYKQERRQQKAYDQANDPKYPVDIKAIHEEQYKNKNEEIIEESKLKEEPIMSLDHDMMLETAIEEYDALQETLEQQTTLQQELNSDDSYNEIVEEPIEEELIDSTVINDELEPNSFENLVADETENLIEQPIEKEVLETQQNASNEILESTVESHIIEAVHNPTETYEGAAADTAEVSVSTEDVPKVRRIELPYKYPSLDLLAKGKPPEGIDEEVEKKAELLEETLESFGISARIINATKGPAVTRYELEPARGVKVSKIVNLTDDIALNLAATGIRMEAPIPGKAAIGIEIPNKSVSSVNLRDVLDCDEFMKARSGIPVGLGKDIAGKSVITDLSKMPHLLVAGSTGSGKSVCINTLISSILFSRKPDEVKMILIDPKMVELSNYNGVPHLMAPVVTDMKKAASVLRWAVREMESRYRTFAETNVRDVKRYNELHPNTAMPLVVIVIDELADLMMVSPADVEDSICRLAQMARAAGLHLVIATQRPSVDVITGTIKANVPSRISFAVSSQIDSRTILDMAGAEKLLGKGDMLFNPIGASKPVRIQGAFISDDEVERLVEFVKKQGKPKYDSKIMEVQENATKVEVPEVVQDELLRDAVDYVMDAGQASASMLQRKLRIGFTRAGRLIDTMEDMKIIGPNAGSKPRELIMNRDEVYETYFSKKID